MGVVGIGDKAPRCWDAVYQHHFPSSKESDAGIWQRMRFFVLAARKYINDLRTTVVCVRVESDRSGVSVITAFTAVLTRDAPDSGFRYPAGYRIGRIVKKYPAG